MSALARWDAFLAQIEGRHRDVIAEAEASARAAIATLAAGGDYLPLSHQLSAIDARLRDRRNGHDAESAHLDASAHRVGRRRRQAGDHTRLRAAKLDTIVGHKRGAAVDQPQRQVRLAAARRSAQQHAHALDDDAGGLEEERFGHGGIHHGDAKA